MLSPAPQFFFLKTLNDNECIKIASGTANNGIIAKGNRESGSVVGIKGANCTGVGKPRKPTLNAIIKSAMPMIFQTTANFLA